MSFDENDLRRALEARSGEPSPEYRSRLRHSLANATPGLAVGWTPVIAVILVTLVTAGSVGALVALRHGRPGPVASAPRAASPSPVTPPTGESNVQLSAPSSSVVWALVDYGVLYLSTDGGDQWAKRSLPGKFGVRPSISFVSSSEGWLLAPGSPTSQCGESAAALWHTTDGAATWVEIPMAGLDPAQCKEVVYFPDAGHGYISAWDDNHQPSVYWSPDGGRSWKRFTLPDPPDFKTVAGGFALRVEWIKKIGATTYLEAYGSQGAGSPYPAVPQRQYIFVSTSGGGAWLWKQKVPSRELAMVTQMRWLEIDPPAQLDESTSGGQQIHPYASDLQLDARAAAGQLLFADDNVGYSLRGGILQRTLNGGAHWAVVNTPWSHTPPPASTPSPPPSPRYFMPAPVLLDAPSHDVVWAYIPYDRVLFLSTDQGDHWQVRNLPPAVGTFPNVTFLDAQNGWFLGGDGASGDCASEPVKIWRTTDGAETWQPVAVTGVSDAQCKEDLVFVDQTHAFMTSEEQNLLPRVYTSGDGGRTWSGTSLSDPARFEGVPDGFAFGAARLHAFGSTVLLSACGNGFLSTVAGCWVYSSTDGGARWSVAATLPSGPGAAQVVFLSPTHWLLMQGPTGARESTDAGKTWRPFANDYDDAAGVASVFVFADSQVGYGTARGSFHRTVDGGAHWTMPDTPWMPPA